MTIYADFEFNNINEEILNLVCCCLYNDETQERLSFWLYNDENEKKKLRNYVIGMPADTFVAYAVVAEARSFYSLGIDPTNHHWIDLFLEWRCLTNHNNKLIVGNHYIDGKIKYIPVPKNKWDRTAEESGYKLKHSLAEATYRLTGEIRDVEHKNEMRDLIISNNAELIEENKESIMKYCMDDVEHLPALYTKMLEEYAKVYSKQDMNTLEDDMIYRGSYAALTAIRESKGYPIDYDKARNFSKNIPLIMDECMREINSLFPQIKPFKWDKLENKFKWNQKSTREWIEKYYDDWFRTDETKRNPLGQISLALESWERKFPFKHEYPKDNFGAQMVRYLKLKQALSGFNAGKGGKSFWDAVGSDKRVRPYMNIYGAQSGRSQPASSSFLFLKPAWCRALMMPAKGKAIVSIDYGSEEFFLSALMSKDANMIKSYLSGDVYLEFAKLSGMVPKDATKATHKFERDLAKSTVLGLSYKMSKYGLANKLTQDLGRNFSVDDAEDLIEKFYDAYSVFQEWQEDLIYKYENKDLKYIRLDDGWTIFGDNPNARSVGNVPVQGMGSCVMREADLLCHEHSLYSPFTLHDALYIEIDANDLKAIDTFIWCMREGFARFFPDQLEIAKQIRLDVYAWSPDYDEDSTLITPGSKVIDCSNVYIDSRAEKEYELFSKYFDDLSMDL
jgi:DNA polymerase I